MPDVTIIRCDGPQCPHEKGENNHWFTLWVFEGEDGRHLSCIDRIIPFKGKNTKYACGQECATKMFNSFLSTGVL